jgi:hypothetical protein
VAQGFPPNVFVKWVYSSTGGQGTLTPIADYSDALGTASAKWDAGTSAPNDVLTITASNHR